MAVGGDDGVALHQVAYFRLDAVDAEEAPADSGGGQGGQTGWESVGGALKEKKPCAVYQSKK